MGYYYGVPVALFVVQVPQKPNFLAVLDVCHTPTR